MSGKQIKRDRQECEISEYLSAVFYAICEVCKTRTRLVANDLDEGASAFYEDGWRVRNDNLQCPKCEAKK